MSIICAFVVELEQLGLRLATHSIHVLGTLKDGKDAYGPGITIVSYKQNRISSVGICR